MTLKPKGSHGEKMSGKTSKDPSQLLRAALLSNSKERRSLADRQTSQEKPVVRLLCDIYFPIMESSFPLYKKHTG